MTTNAVRQLEGTSVLDYLDSATYVQESSPDAFLNEISLVANSDLQGSPDVIDRGDEAIALANLFITHYPTALPRTITSADLSDYLTGLWSPSRQVVETQVESLLHQIERGVH